MWKRSSSSWQTPLRKSSPPPSARTRWAVRAVSVVDIGQTCRSCTALTPGWAQRKARTADMSTLGGAVSMARSKDSRRTPRVPNRMMAVVAVVGVVRVGVAAGHDPIYRAGGAFRQRADVSAAAVEVVQKRGVLQRHEHPRRGLQRGLGLRELGRGLAHVHVGHVAD